jgi:hypothetical protein
MSQQTADDSLTEDIPIRKEFSIMEKIHADGVREVENPILKSAAIAVIENPYSESYTEDLSLLTEWGVGLGHKLTSTAVHHLGGANEVEGYGKGGIVGTDGEREHVAAIIHPKLGGAMREEVDGGEAIIPSSKKMGPPGTTLDVPTHFKDGEWVASHWDAMEVNASGAPHPDEIVIAVVVTNGGRPHPRIDGKTIDDVSIKENK